MMYFRKTVRPLALVLTLVLLLSCMPIALAETFSAFVTSSSMAVYSDAGLTNHIGTLGQYTVVSVNGYSGGVAQISAYGNTGFARISDMQRVDAVAVPAVTNTNTRVFQAPSTASASAPVAAGTKVNVIAVINGVALVEKDGIGGYTLAAHLTTVDASQPQAPSAPDMFEETFTAVVTDEVLSVYKENDGFAELGKLTKGTEVTVTAYNSEWVRVEMFGNVGYVRMSGLARKDAAAAPTAAPTQAPSTQNSIPGTVVSAVKVYQYPSTSSRYLGTVGAGTQMNVLAVQSGWAWVELNGNYGYCAVANLVPTSSLATAEPTLAPTIAPTAAPTAAPSAPEGSIPGIVVSRVSVYQYPSTSSTCYGTVGVGTVMNVIAVQNGWAWVELNGNYGYCYVSALVPASTMVTPAPTVAPTQNPLQNAVAVTVITPVKVYQYPTTASASAGPLSVGTQLNLVEVQNGWALVELNGNYAFCSADALRATSENDTIAPAPTAPSSAPEGSIPGTVISAVKVYQYPSTSSKYLGTVGAGTQMNVLAIKGGWAWVELNGSYGYCAVANLVPTSSLATPAPTTAPTAAPSDPDGFIPGNASGTVVVASAKFYSSPSADAQSIDVGRGTNVAVTGISADGQWARIQVNGVTGYMVVSALNVTEYSQLSKGSTGSSVSSLGKALLVLGYLDVQPGDTYTDYTVNAVKLFQTACGMSATGVADQATLRVLFGGSAPANSILSGSYAKGSTGTNVGRIQMRLYSLGYLSKSSSVDGDFGNNTYNAVKLFQSCNGLSATGSADSGTLKKLYSTTAVALPSGKTPGDVVTVVQPSAGNQQNNSTHISSTLASQTSSYNSGMTAAEKLEYVIYVGQNQLGKPYVFGAQGTSSFDCSGFTKYCFKQIGITLQRTAINQGYDDSYTRIDSVSELRRGDMVFFNTTSDRDLSDHAGIYLGAGYFIHASSGQAKVVVSNLASGYYNRVFSWGRRIIG